jgi:CarD family transcriptional regulator
MYSVGNKIVHPMHGAGVIQRIEKRKILGEVKRYYILQLPNSTMRVMIPVESKDSVGIRPVSDKEVVEEVLALLCEESTPMEENWNKRYKENMNKLKSGDIIKVAEVVRNLMRLSRKKDLSAGESKMLENARAILESEIILSCDISAKEAQNLIEESI